MIYVHCAADTTVGVTRTGVIKQRSVIKLISRLFLTRIGRGMMLLTVMGFLFFFFAVMCSLKKISFIIF